MTDWNIKKSRALYNIEHWGVPYFDINPSGNICITPTTASSSEIDLYEISKTIKKSGVEWPVLLRVTDILTDRINTLIHAFEEAKSVCQYNGRYIPAYPIKVNQQRTVVEHLQSKSDSVGIEVGSKPELMLALSHAKRNSMIICNGYKDREYIRFALIGQQIGHRVIIVIEKLSELEIIIEEANKAGCKPLLGVRLRLSSISKGNWQNSGGEKSKFGLSASQVLIAIRKLKHHKCLDSLQLMHCHLGSQLANIRDIQTSLREMSKFFVELSSIGAPINYIDAGGGLGIDYEGTHSRSFCSMNYSVQEYANQIIQTFAQTCKQHNLPQPNIITESGRALTAHHAILITNVVDNEQYPVESIEIDDIENQPIEIINLWESRQNLNKGSIIESYHDASHWLNECQLAYIHGGLSLYQRSLAEKIYFNICQSIKPLLSRQSARQREIYEELNEKLADKVFCNFSLFQSLPDVWAINQIFPITPLHRLDEKPSRQAILHDLTCDSDGAISNYVQNDDITQTLAVHEDNGDEYMLGFFLTGAYQEILGDMHNLFGDTHAIDVGISENGEVKLSNIEKGDTIEEVLRYVHYEKADILNKYQAKIEYADLPDNLQEQFLIDLKMGLEAYTYLSK